MSILSRNAGLKEGKKDREGTSWYLPLYDSSRIQQDSLNCLGKTETLTELSHFKILVCSNGEQQQNEMMRDLGVGEEIDLLIYFIVGFHQREKESDRVINF